jgi:uncharacterized membrane protein (DUF2068 family)
MVLTRDRSGRPPRVTREPTNPEDITNDGAPRRKRSRALVLIIAYKVGKGTLWLIFAVGLMVLMNRGLGDHLLGFAEHLRHHAHAWSLELADLVVRAASGRVLWTIVVALLADGVVSLFEGWALLHGRWWGPWLVVVSTGSLLPFEVAAFVRHPHLIRASVFVLNLAIVVYLARKAMGERRLKRMPVLTQ